MPSKISWTPDVKIKLLLTIIDTIQIVHGSKGIPWAEVAKAMGPQYTISGIQQAYRLNIKKPSKDLDKAASTNQSPVRIISATPSAAKALKERKVYSDEEDDEEQLTKVLKHEFDESEDDDMKSLKKVEETYFPTV